MADVEVIVVGGGPGGSTVAAELAGLGHRVVLLDKATFPRHKACSEYINPGGARILRDLGIESEVLAAGAHRMEAMQVHAPNGDRFLANFDRAEPGQAALGLSRWTLDALLLNRAKAAGVEVREGTHVRSVVSHAGRATGVDVTIDGVREEIRAPLIIGADGRNSVVTRSLGLDLPVRWPDKTGLVAHYRGVTGLDHWGEMHIGNGFYAGLAPLEDGLVNVAVVSGSATIRQRPGSIDDFFERSLMSKPAIAEKLAGAERVGTIRGVGSMAHRVRRTTGDGFLLVGDAASFLDPFTGEGIYEALRAARLAAPVASAALRSGEVSADLLEPYRRARRRVFTAKRQVCWIVQGFINAPPLMNYITPRLDARDDLGMTLSGVLGNFTPATRALSPIFLARLLRP